MRTTRAIIISLSLLLFVSIARAQAPEPKAAADRVDLIAMGDWGRGNADQKVLANSMAAYSETQAKDRPLDATLLLGDNFYVPLLSARDAKFQSLFEEMYDIYRMPMPFYIALGNHDYERAPEATGPKADIELEYARIHPESRWKMPAKWYRVDLPAAKPIVTILMLDSDQQALAPEQWTAETAWLKETLEQPRTAPWIICCAHHTMFGNGSHGDNGVLQTTWGPLFKEHHVDFYVCGHEHTMQHLQIPGWNTTFVVSGGGGAARKPMLRDNRGPFSRSTMGFAHLTFAADQVTTRLMDGDGKPLHTFRRDHQGNISIDFTSASDTATTQPLRVIQNLPDKEKRKANGGITED